VGNRLTKKITKGSTVNTDTYSYNAANQLTKVNGTSITNDKNGNLTNDGKRTYVYDAQDRLIEVKEGTNSIAKYQYNSDGLRVSKTIGSTTVYYTYDENNNVILETDQTGKVLVSYTYDSNDNPLTMIKDGKTYTFHSNARGDVTKVTDEQGSIVASFEYDSWGNVVKETGNFVSSVPFRYAGYRYDVETKLYYLQQRYYNPETGRFLTLDPVLGDKENPITQNGYVYADNNPVMLKDPDGEYVKHYYNKAKKKVDKTLRGWAKKGYVKKSIGKAALKGAAKGAAKGAIIGYVGGSMKVGRYWGGSYGKKTAVKVGATGGAVLGYHLGAVGAVNKTVIKHYVGKAYVIYKSRRK
jgi:RHS repeat-associated protein